MEVAVTTGFESATWLGRVCAIAAGCQRDLQRCADTYPDLFPPKPFDPTLFGTVAQANAFSAPWLTADQLRMANRASLWGFGVDWQIDYLSTSQDEVDEIVRRCLAVADHRVDGDDSLTRLLGGIRDDLTATAGFDDLRDVWQAELRRMLDAMALEWRWRAAARDHRAELPSLDEYVGNADNLGSSFVDISHWIFTRTAGTPSDVEAVIAACRSVQQILRLLNDLGTHERDAAWGDLNVLMLGVDLVGVTERIRVLMANAQRHIAVLAAHEPELATFLERQIGFCTGFYRVTDYWGEL